MEGIINQLPAGYFLGPVLSSIVSPTTARGFHCSILLHPQPQSKASSEGTIAFDATIGSP
jgi:hypothetical protein